MAKKYALQAKTREGAVNAVRKNGNIPAILYGHGIESKSLQLTYQDFLRVYRAAGTTSLVTVTVDGKEELPTIIRDVQLHPVKSNILHVDFYQVRMDEKIHADVPLHFVGEAPAVKDLGGTLVRNMDEVDLEALPNDLPHDIEVDISQLDNFDKVIHVSDLHVPEGVELFHEDDEVVALVQAPRTQEEIDEELAEDVSEEVESVEGVKEEEAPEEGEEGTDEQEQKEGE